MFSELLIMIQPPVRCDLLHCPVPALAKAHQDLSDKEAVAREAKDWETAQKIKPELDEVTKKLNGYEGPVRDSICIDCPHF